jgi:hypothetical protein
MRGGCHGQSERDRWSSRVRLGRGSIRARRSRRRPGRVRCRASRCRWAPNLVAGGPRADRPPRERRPRLLREGPQEPTTLAGLFFGPDDRLRLGSRLPQPRRPRSNLAVPPRAHRHRSPRGGSGAARGRTRSQREGGTFEDAGPRVRRHPDPLGNRRSGLRCRDRSGGGCAHRTRPAPHRRAARRLLRRAGLVGVRSRRRRFRESGTALHGNARDQDVHGGAGVRSHPAAAPGHEAALAREPRPASPAGGRGGALRAWPRGHSGTGHPRSTGRRTGDPRRAAPGAGRRARSRGPSRSSLSPPPRAPARAMAAAGPRRAAPRNLLCRRDDPRSGTGGSLHGVRARRLYQLSLLAPLAGCRPSGGPTTRARQPEDALRARPALRRVAGRGLRGLVLPGRDEGLAQARCLCRDALARAGSAKSPLGGGCGRAAARCLLSHRPERHRRSPGGDPRGRCRLRLGHGARRLAARSRARTAAHPLGAAAARGRPRLRTRRLRAARLHRSELLGRGLGLTAASRSWVTTIGWRTGWMPGSR